MRAELRSPESQHRYQLTGLCNRITLSLQLDQSKHRKVKGLGLMRTKCPKLCLNLIEVLACTVQKAQQFSSWAVSSIAWGCGWDKASGLSFPAIPALITVLFSFQGCSRADVQMCSGYRKPNSSGDTLQWKFFNWCLWWAGCHFFCHCTAIVAHSWKHFFSEYAMRACGVCLHLHILNEKK